MYSRKFGNNNSLCLRRRTFRRQKQAHYTRVYVRLITMISINAFRQRSRMRRKLLEKFGCRRSREFVYDEISMGFQSWLAVMLNNVCINLYFIFNWQYSFIWWHTLNNPQRFWLIYLNWNSNWHLHICNGAATTKLPRFRTEPMNFC